MRAVGPREQLALRRYSISRAESPAVASRRPLVVASDPSNIEIRKRAVRTECFDQSQVSRLQSFRVSRKCDDSDREPWLASLQP